MTTPRPVTRHDYPDSFGQWKSSVEKRLNKLFTRATSAAPAIVGTGGDFIVNGLMRVTGMLELVGNLSLKDSDGNELVRLGDLLFGKGIQFVRNDASVAASFGKPLPGSTTEAFLLYDMFGSQILGQSTLGGGVGRPLMENPVQPIAAASGTAAPTIGPFGWEKVTTSATFETLFAYDGRTQNGFLKFKYAFLCSDGTTAGEIRLINLDTGVALPGFLAPPLVTPVPAGSTTYTTVDVPSSSYVTPALFGNAYTAFRIGVQARRTAGAGTITLAVPQAMGG